MKRVNGEQGKYMLGEFLKEERKKKGLSLQEFATILGISSSYLYRIETGDRKNPSAMVINILAKYFNVPTDYIVSMTGYGVKEKSDEQIYLDKIINEKRILFLGYEFSEEDKNKLFKLIKEIIIGKKDQQLIDLLQNIFS